MDGATSILSSEPHASKESDAARGTISLIAGCMFSGKTTALFRLIEKRRSGSEIVIKHIIDTRYRVDAVVSHGGKAHAAIAVASSLELQERVTPGVKLVAIDEAHFFDEAIVAVVEELSRRGIEVSLTSLDRDSWGRSFPLVEQIAAIANNNALLTATCGPCGASANRTQRLTPIVNGNMVGGPESYEPRCERCWTAPPEPAPSRMRSRVS